MGRKRQRKIESYLITKDYEGKEKISMKGRKKGREGKGRVGKGRDE